MVQRNNTRFLDNFLCGSVSATYQIGRKSLEDPMISWN